MVEHQECDAEVTAATTRRRGLVPLKLSLKRLPSRERAMRPFIAGLAPAGAPELREQMASHGHLFFAGLLPRELVLEARAEALALCRNAGWIRSSEDPLLAQWSGSAPVYDETSPTWTEFYRRWIHESAFQSLPEHPAMVAVARKLLCGDVLVHPRKIGRIAFPQNEGHQTHAHQDFFYVHGTSDTYTAWVPLGDCPMRLGCLAVADGSHRAGLRDHTPSAGPGGWSVDTDAHVIWRSQDFSAGDVLIFHSLTLHAALPNRTRDTLRVSIDNRYQRLADGVDPTALRPHIE
jgi:hypothetical protein